jgi:hypothetical protein
MYKQYTAIGIVVLIMLATVQMGAATAEVTGSVTVLACPQGTIGFSTDVSSLAFGSLYPGVASESLPFNVTVTASGYQPLPCNNMVQQPLGAGISIALGMWQGATPANTMPAISTVLSSVPDGNTFPIGTTTLGAIVTPLSNTVPDTYTQIITLTLVS